MLPGAIQDCLVYFFRFFCYTYYSGFTCVFGLYKFVTIYLPRPFCPSTAGQEDYLVDALALHDHMHLLRPILADPAVLKVIPLYCMLYQPPTTHVWCRVTTPMEKLGLFAELLCFFALLQTCPAILHTCLPFCTPALPFCTTALHCCTPALNLRHPPCAFAHVPFLFA